MTIFAYAIKLLIAGLFLHAGISKLNPQNQHYYQGVVQGYGFTDSSFKLGSLLNIMPFIIGGFETLTALAIVIQQTTSFGLVAAAALLGLYGAIFAKQLLQGKADINCGCAGPGADVKISPMLLLRNGVLVALCVFALLVESSSFAASWFVVLPLAAVLSLIYLSSEQLMLNQQKIQMLRES